MSRTAAFVPLKLNNERLPGKNTKLLSDGTPLVSLILQTLQKVNNIDDIYVYCSNESVVDYLPHGVKFLKRSAHLDQSTTKINEVLSAFAKDVPADVYVLAHATAPFLKPESIETGVNKVCSGQYDSALTVHKMQEFVWKDGQPMNYDLAAVPRTQDLDPLFIETTGLYIYTHDLIAQRNTRIGDRPYLIEVSSIESLDINNPIDFEIADAVYTHVLAKRSDLS
ncbi:cytidylyltransferase domain-containing protein [Enterobacter roggenkampii]|uniref:acylneuraminate cytidylyltransferase family protein n=1 Tax=Enterobacter roggenkampii TaxID=1812935 RepID=UPI0015E58ED5|nr:acylneuraminate cytidylyltransferase family protein [Enterobacter roggenkampii]QLP25058.1 acylneuraminate cytidylyltransferase family protein [Enterobacter roggenkampii]